MSPVPEPADPSPRVSARMARMRAGLSAFPWRGFVLALVIAGAGGLLFSMLRLPLPWMLGPMVACTLASLLAAPIAAPIFIRPPNSAVIGVLIGSSFSPETLAHLVDWLPTLLGLVAFTLVAALANVAYFRRVGGFDLPTAYFAGMPGGLIEMVVMGEERGGDGRTMALVHSARILLVVLTLPFVVQAVSGVSLSARPAVGQSVMESGLDTWAWLIGTAFVGLLLGRSLRIPARDLFGPAILSAGVHAVGLTNFVPQSEIVAICQLVLGMTLGARFAGVPPAEILRVLKLAVGSTVILGVITIVFAVALSGLTSVPTIALILAFAPGGLSEMSLIALGLGIETAFVASHHIARIFLVLAAAPPLFALLGHGGPAADDGDDDDGPHPMLGPYR